MNSRICRRDAIVMRDLLLKYDEYIKMLAN